MSTNTNTQSELNRLASHDSKEAILIDSVCRPQNSGDPQEAMLREALGARMIMAQRLCEKAMAEDPMITVAAREGSAETQKISPTLTAFLRLMREIRAQDRFLRQYLKNPMPTETSQQADRGKQKRCQPTTGRVYVDRAQHQHRQALPRQIHATVAADTQQRPQTGPQSKFKTTGSAAAPRVAPTDLRLRTTSSNKIGNRVNLPVTNRKSLKRIPM